MFSAGHLQNFNKKNRKGKKIMKIRTKVMVLGLVMAMVFCYAGIVGADSSAVTGAAAGPGGTGASADLDFQIIIPSFIYFRVGSVSGVDTVDFQPTVNDVATGAATNATSGGTVDVVLLSNAGQITIEEANDGGGNGLDDGGTNYISWGQIVATPNSAGLDPPQLSNTGGNTSVIAVTSGNITAKSTQWIYVYNNPATPPASGTYTGTATYTAAIP